jgi:predicted nucleic acid-binding protein
VSFLLDTNVVSEWIRPRPNAAVVAWLAQADEDRIFLSVITLAEVRYGIEDLAAGQRRRRLDEWLRTELPLRFKGRILSVDGTVADVCGKIMARSKSTGRPISVGDAFIAATAEVHGLTLVTRNAKHFESVLNTVVNPWADNPGVHR